MTYQDKYSQARKAGYTDQEIMEHLAEKDPTFEQKMVKAQEAGYTPQEVLEGQRRSSCRQGREREVHAGRNVYLQGHEHPQRAGYRAGA